MNRDNRVQVYLSDSELKQLSEWSEETGKSQSHLCREAVLEYTDNDRVSRLEGRMDGVESKLDEILAHLESNDAHTHKDQPPMSNTSDALETAREIVRRIQSNHDEVVKDEAVVRAIEDHAGIDDRTIRKYKRLFRKRGLLFEHPGNPPLWTTESNQWLDWMRDFAALNGYDDAEAIVNNYPARVTETMDGKIGIELHEQ